MLINRCRHICKTCLGLRSFASTNKLDPRFDWVGPPNPYSRLRPLVFESVSSGTPTQHEFRAKWDKTFEWNEEYWKQHNLKFAKERSAYMESLMEHKGLQSPSQVSPDDMAIFYEQFMNHNQASLDLYNRTWYKKNFSLLWLAFKAKWKK